MLVEIIGYVGTILVLISMLMTSIVKLRILNAMGCLITMIYALIIHSYPIAVTNGVLIVIDIWRLIKLRKYSE